MNLNFLNLRSVKSRISIFSLVIFVTSIWVLVFYTSLTLRDGLERQIGDHQMSAVGLLASNVNEELVERVNALEAVAGQINPALMGSPSELQNLIQNRPILGILFNAGNIVLNLEGDAIADMPRSAKRIGQNYIDRDFVIAALKEGKSSIGKPVMGKILNAPLFAIATPIKNTEGQVIGALVGVTNLGTPNFLDNFTNNQYGKTGGYALVDAKNRLIITATDKRLVMSPILPAGASPLVDRFVLGGEGTGIFKNPLGIELLASSKQVPFAGWYVTASLPTAEAFALISVLQERLLYAALALTLISVVLTWLMLKQQLLPLVNAAQNLTDQAKSSAPLQPLPVRDDDEIGALIGGFNQVLGKLRERETSLVETSKRIQLATDSGGIGIWDYDLTTGSLVWDSWMYKLYGGLSCEDVGAIALWTNHLHPDDKAAAEAALQQTIASGLRFSSAFRVIWADGSVHYLRGFGVAEKDVSGTVVRIIGTNWDITEAQEREVALVKARADAELASQSKGQFLANMSHEIRTPMNAILGLLKLAQSTDLTARQRDYIDKTHSAAQSLLGLLNDILDFSKVEAGKMTLEREPFSFHDLLRNLSVVLSANVGARDTEVLFDIDPELPDVVLGDSRRLQQILINLGGNAVKFTDKGQVVVTLKSTPTDSNQVRVEFSVQDSGIGIAPENQAHIFSGFSQAEGSTTRRFGGTGLGLAIGQRMVNLMGGHIELTSTLGVGSTFSFAVEFPVPAEIPEELQSETRPSPSPHAVLIVDDNAIAGEITTRAVRSWGWNAQWVDSGQQALMRIEQDCKPGAVDFPYPTIFVDWQMHGLDGWETTRRIREFAKSRQLPQPKIVMLSGHGRDSLAQRTEAEQNLLTGFLVKPATPSMLFDAIMDVTSGAAGMRRDSRAKASARRLHGMRILVVEDNMINQQVAEELLSSEGAIVFLAANGRLGVEAVQNAAPQFDVVLMDLQMPVLDGYGATQEIRESLGLRALPIVAMTANAMDRDREACLAAGMNEHISKPFDMNKLVELLIRTAQFEPLETDDAFPVAMAGAKAPEWFTPGIDLSTALARMSGMQSLYLRTGKAFVKVLDTCMADIEQQSAAGNDKGLAMQLHTLKGNAGTLGASALAEAARELENRVKESDDLTELGQAMSSLASTVALTQSQLISALAQLQAASPAPAKLNNASSVRVAATAQDAASVLEALKTLKAISALAGAGDMAVLGLFAESRDALEALSISLFEELDLALQDLEFDRARATCDTYLLLQG